jgi:hypothetical protein
MSYNLLNPLDYLRLFYYAFFNWGEFPEPEERVQQYILISQGLVLIIVVNVLVGLGVASGGGRLTGR